MKYKVKKQIHSCCASMCSNDVWLEFEFELPFKPYAGLNIVGNDVDFTIEEMYWDLRTKEFVLYCEQDKTFWNLKLNNDETKFKNLIEEYKRKGWKEYVR